MRQTLKLRWQEYPIGAHIILMDGAVAVYVYRVRGKWAATYSSYFQGSGELFLTEGRSTRFSAQIYVEEWLRRHAIDLLDALGLTVNKRLKMSLIHRRIGFSPKKGKKTKP